MLKDDAIDFIESLVSDNLYREIPFTSLDIANAAKDEGYWARNNEVGKWLRSNVIRIAYDQGCLYNQTLIRVDAKGVGPTLAYLYHHMNTDPDTYLDRDQNPKSCHKPVPVAVTPGASFAQTLADITRRFGLVKQTGDPSVTATQQPTLPDFASRQAARDWLKINPDYMLDDRGPYSTSRWGVKKR